MERLLAQINPDAPPLLPDEARLLALLLQKFTPSAAPLLVTDAHCRELFIRALKTQHRSTARADLQDLQTTALEQVSAVFEFLNGECFGLQYQNDDVKRATGA